jgi:hypothetical protein
MFELGILLLILLHKAQKTVFSPAETAAAAAEAKKKAEQAAAEARAAAARGDAEEAKRKAKEAQAHHQQGTAMEQAAKTPVPWPQALPGDLPPFPAGWAPASPVTSAMVTRAFQLLPTLWTRGAGSWTAEKTGAQWVVYQAQQMGEKRGVVVFTPKLGAVTVKPTAAPAQRPPQQSPGVVPVSTTRPAAAPAAPASRYPTLRLTSPYTKGPSVVWLQQQLKISADGTFGPATQKAVIAYQARNGLTADGIVGPQTWAKLGASSAQAA